MFHDKNLNIKDNVQRFDADVLEFGSYAYTQEHLSARTANARISLTQVRQPALQIDGKLRPAPDQAGAHGTTFV